MLILSTAYLGNVQYYTKLLDPAPDTVIEAHENFQKQSFRNRCDILAGGGVVTLTVPVVKNSGLKTPVKDVLIDYSRPWQHRHWLSIVSAYANSPYFEHYRDAFEPFYLERTKFLWDLNLRMQSTILDLLGITCPVEYSKAYIVAGERDTDLRDSLSPKPRLHVPDRHFRASEYCQVFSDRYGFVPNLSIIDLLFCEGPHAVDAIRRSKRE